MISQENYWLDFQLIVGVQIISQENYWLDIQLIIGVQMISQENYWLDFQLFVGVQMISPSPLRPVPIPFLATIPIKEISKEPLKPDWQETSQAKDFSSDK